ncbi:hypothetical protein WJX84_007317 [Apatococcus fuscideae]|uniref:Uncharacterized protein n=1 Tax=Apatococcus fuscideae TaxID=2026836 RepID=A0AAW1S7Q5_9CHLO
MDLVAIKVEFTFEDKTIKECFSISASAQDQDVRSLAKITCREANLPVHCQRLVQQAVVDQILAFRTAQGTSSHGPKVAHTERLEKLSIDCCVGTSRLRDQLTWDFNNPDHQPEAIAHKLCQDLALDCSFQQQVAWQIRSLVQERQKLPLKKSSNQVVTGETRNVEEEHTRPSKRRKKRVCSQPTVATSTYATGVVCPKKDRGRPLLDILSEEELASRSAHTAHVPKPSPVQGSLATSHSDGTGNSAGPSKSTCVSSAQDCHGSSGHYARVHPSSLPMMGLPEELPHQGQDLMQANHMLGSIPHQAFAGRQQQQQQPHAAQAERLAGAITSWPSSQDADARQGQQLQGRPGLPVQDQPAAAKGMRQAGRDQEGRLAVAQHEMPQRMQPVAAQLEEKLASSGSRLNAASSMIHPSRAELEGMGQKCRPEEGTATA